MPKNSLCCSALNASRYPAPATCAISTIRAPITTRCETFSEKAWPPPPLTEVQAMKLFPTTIVGSYPQPEWLIDRSKLAGRFPPRVRAQELWRIAPQFLQEAQDDATIMAIKAQEDAGIDIVTDGEMRRESYSNRFATALEGVDIENPGTRLDRTGKPSTVPRVAGPIPRRHAVEVRDVEFLRANTAHTIKITVPGAFTRAPRARPPCTFASALGHWSKAGRTAIPFWPSSRTPRSSRSPSRQRNQSSIARCS